MDNNHRASGEAIAGDRSTERAARKIRGTALERRLVKQRDELLMALEIAISALEWCEKQWADSPQKGDGINVLQFARAAIAKAEGRS